VVEIERIYREEGAMEDEIGGGKGGNRWRKIVFGVEEINELMCGEYKDIIYPYI